MTISERNKLQREKYGTDNNTPQMFPIGTRVQIITTCQDHAFFKGTETGEVVNWRPDYLGIEVRLDEPIWVKWNGNEKHHQLTSFNFNPQDLIRLEDSKMYSSQMRLITYDATKNLLVEFHKEASSHHLLALIGVVNPRSEIVAYLLAEKADGGFKTQEWIYVQRNDIGLNWHASKWVGDVHKVTFKDLEDIIKGGKNEYFITNVYQLQQFNIMKFDQEFKVAGEKVDLFLSNKDEVKVGCRLVSKEDYINLGIRKGWILHEDIDES